MEIYETWGTTNSPVIDRILADGFREIEIIDTVYQCTTVPTVKEYIEAQDPLNQVPLWRPSCLFEVDRNTPDSDIESMLQLLKANVGGMGVEDPHYRRDNVSSLTTQHDTDQLNLFLLNLGDLDRRIYLSAS